MSRTVKNENQCRIQFITFTCFRWISLFSITNSYDLVYKWFDCLIKKDIQILSYVIMPNHLHVILYFPDDKHQLGKIISNGKRFMAYGIIERLKSKGNIRLLRFLNDSLTSREKEKGQLHKVFKDSFDARAIFSEKFLFQKANYIHRNPVKGKWHLCAHFEEYEHSSAPYYIRGIVGHCRPFDFRDIIRASRLIRSNGV